ncbi:hypothetical protein PGT21_017681 [Puccinia graminis f. sp. tritici]|uniref:Uncharacterized protein n=1 Tax=Puccinia graminis f. sp. tritici TaxID=56615 RepID=A0A5B0PRA2_PUCGR|nr:hypothetical protein PGT21_017681 [Puccinia graminis f. sp. tritici]
MVNLAKKLVGASQDPITLHPGQAPGALQMLLSLPAHCCLGSAILSAGFLLSKSHFQPS